MLQGLKIVNAFFLFKIYLAVFFMISYLFSIALILPVPSSPDVSYFSNSVAPRTLVFDQAQRGAYSVLYLHLKYY